MSSLGFIFINDNISILLFVLGTASNSIMLYALYIYIDYNLTFVSSKSVDRPLFSSIKFLTYMEYTT